jgi:hypothetical protein
MKFYLNLWLCPFKAWKVLIRNLLFAGDVGLAAHITEALCLIDLFVDASSEPLAYKRPKSWDKMSVALPVSENFDYLLEVVEKFTYHLQ